MTVDGDEGEVGRTYMATFTGDVALNPHLYAGLHGGVEGAVDGRAEDDEVADMNGNEEVEVIDRSGDDVALGVAMGGESSGDIDPVHEAAAKEGSERVRIVRHDDFDHFGLAVANRTGFKRGCLFHRWVQGCQLGAGCFKL